MTKRKILNGYIGMMKDEAAPDLLFTVVRQSSRKPLYYQSQQKTVETGYRGIKGSTKIFIFYIVLSLRLKYNLLWVAICFISLTQNITRCVHCMLILLLVL